METFSALLALCELKSPHTGQWHGALMFPLICTWTKGCANNRFFKLVNNPKHVFITLEGVSSQDALGEHMDEGLDSLDFDGCVAAHEDCFAWKNVALFSSCSSSSHATHYPCERALDGNGLLNNGWQAAGALVGEWLKVRIDNDGVMTSERFPYHWPFVGETASGLLHPLQRQPYPGSPFTMKTPSYWYWDSH